MLRHLIPLFPLLISTAGLAEGTDLKPVIAKVVTAVGGEDKLLKIFRIGEIFHFGDKPEPPEGKTRSTRESVLEMPDGWWLKGAERGDEPAKYDVWAWTLGILVDPASKVEIAPDFTDEGVDCFVLKVSGSITPAMTLYFDKQTSLLKRIDWRSDYYRFSDWKEHDGVKYASRSILFKIKDDKPWFFHEITSIERLATLPEGLKRP
ncbi:MAG: hypothetical protein ABL994_02760 [Verrucomicrobiales bacterium]